MSVVTNDFSAKLVVEFSLGAHIALVELLVENVQDDMDLRKLIDESGNKPVIALIQLRLKKIVDKAISQKQFINDYSINKVIALTDLFQHPIANWHVRRLDKQLFNEETTLGGLYDRFQERHANLGLLLH